MRNSTKLKETQNYLHQIRWLFIKAFFTMLLLLVQFALNAQAITVKGTVKGSDGITIPGVSVIVKGTNQGTSTDANGDYAISASPDGILVFSAIGYDNEEVSIGANERIDITLHESLTSLTEVVVVGYGTQRKSDL